MGLFDKVLGKDKADAQVTLNKNEAFAAVAVAAIAADGSVSEDELNRTVSNLAHIGLFRRYDMRDMADVLNKTAGLIRKRGAGPMVSAAKAALSNEESETAFFVAADLVLADGVVEAEERKFLEELRATLGVGDEMAMKIVEVVVVKNRS